MSVCPLLNVSCNMGIGGFRFSITNVSDFSVDT